MWLGMESLLWKCLLTLVLLLQPDDLSLSMGSSPLAPSAVVLVELRGLGEVPSCRLICLTVPDAVHGSAAVAQLIESLVLFPQLSTVVWDCPQDSLCDICAFVSQPAQ